MKAISENELVKVLQREGGLLMRIHGSHHIYGKPGSVVRLSVPIHGNKPLKQGLLKHLMNMAGLHSPSGK